MKRLKKNTKLVVVLLISFLVAFTFVFAMVFDLIKSIYEMYYADSEIGEFFKEQGQNIFTNDVRIETFRLVIWRFIYMFPGIMLAVFLVVYFRAKSFSERILEKKIFKDNPSLSKILMIGRYLLGMGLAFLVLTRGRTFFSSCFHNCIIGNSIDFVRVFFASVLLVLPVLDYKKLWGDIISFGTRRPKLTCFFFMFFISVISTCLVEFQIGSKMSMLIYILHINIFYWLLLQLILLAIFRNPKPGAIISLLFSFAIGLANDIVYQFRGNYIMFGDLTVMRTAFEVAGNYAYKPTKWLWISVILLVVSVVFVIFVKFSGKKIEEDGEKDNDKKAEDIKKNKAIKRIVSTMVFEGLIAIFIFVTFRTGDFYGKVFGVGWNYNENVSAVGYLAYFFSNMDSQRKVVVEGYSTEQAKNIFDQFEVDKTNQNEKEDGKVYPNIILIQNEAFSDLSILADIETDKDTMPFIHSMSENTQKGFLNMSVTGGPTSNTEFEILSRSSLQFFPYGSVPYTQYLKQHIPSLTEALKAQDNPYHTVAYHSYYSSGYNRNSVYSFMGFEEKLFENNFFNDYEKVDLPRDYLSDEANYRRVIKSFEENQASGQPYFCFNVTIQGHGGYTGGPFDLPEDVKVTNFEATDSINTYLSLIRMSDKAFEGLVDYFSKIDEPTVIMMYGDHQPSWDDEANEILAEHPAWDDEALQTLSTYYVPYIIWANYDIEEVDNLGQWYGDCGVKLPEQDIKLNTLSTNYVGSTLMDVAGLDLSTYDQYLLNLHEEVPAITAVGVWDANGNYFGAYQDSPSVDSLSDLEMLQYNLIFDEDKLTDYFLPRDD